MWIRELRVKDFRNHKNTKIVLDNGVNVFVGKNAQGKTNLLEAIFLTCVGRGWRTRNDREMINFDADTAVVKAVAQKSYGDVNVEILLSRTSKKAIKINSIPVQKMGELMGQINCVFFSPDELRLIKDAPADRRRFLDISLSQLDKNYFYSLLRYNKILAQRNSLLKSTTEDIERGLDIWDNELVKEGAKIIYKRIDFLQQIRPSVEGVHSFLTNKSESIEIVYESNLKLDGCQEDIEKCFLEALMIAREKDMRQRTTTIGPHRDDICISINGKDVRQFASQGQQRTVALSIKLAEVRVFKEQTGEMPVLLLDDVLSELDESRQERLLEAIKGVQAVITTTQNVDGAAKTFKIREGDVL
ncbi:MAG: DNA replication/repair protein RecF [Firmicutes bacterium]|nr:DNA replication/repair protein RecF [Bacillota bacterium]